MASESVAKAVESNHKLPNAPVTSVVLDEDDIDSFNAAMSLAFTGSWMEAETAAGCADSGVHLRNVCTDIATHLSKIRSRQNKRGGILLGGVA